MWYVGMTARVLVVAITFALVGCGFGIDGTKGAPPKVDDPKQKAMTSGSPQPVEQVAQVKSTPVARPATISTASPIPPTATPSPTPSPRADLVFVRDGNLWLAELKNGSQIPLTVDGGNSSPVWSPEGNSIAFVHATGAASELHRIDARGNDRRKLVGGDVVVLDPQWSPSGDAILFAVNRDTNKDAKLDERDVSEVWLINGDGSGSRKVAEGMDPTWAPEGLRIAYATNGMLEKDVPYRRANGIDVINRQGKNDWTLVSTTKVPVEVTLGGNKFNAGVFLLRNPSWSSSKMVSFTAVGHTGMVLTISEKSTDLRTWAANYEGGFLRSFWSPKGDFLAFESAPASGINSVGITSLPTGRTVSIGGARTGLSFRSPSWSPDGRLVALVQEAGTKFVGVVSPDGEGLRQVASGNVSDPQWNPRSR